MSVQPEAPPLHPGVILLERVMRPLGISRNQLARDIDVPVGRISDLTNGKRGITADTALRLGRYFGIAPQIWLRLQAEYDLHVARSTTWREIEPRVRVFGGVQRPHGGARDKSIEQATAKPTDMLVVSGSASENGGEAMPPGSEPVAASDPPGND